MLLIKKKNHAVSLSTASSLFLRAMFLKAVILGAGMAGYLARGLEFGKRVDALMSSELR